jgi:hypothetical protein
MYSLIAKLFGVILEFLWSKKQQPGTINDEKVPNDIKRDWNNYVDHGLRDKGGGDQQR